jgi:hypothetical protein
MHSSPPRDLRTEMIRRMNDGWDVEGEGTATEMTMRHSVSPPAWRLALDMLNPLVWLFGPTWPNVYRTLHVRVDEDGRVHRRTTGRIPAHWPQEHAWEVPDGPVES